MEEEAAGESAASPDSGRVPALEPGEPSYRILELSIGVDSDLVIKVRRELAEKIYDSRTARRYAEHDALAMVGDAVLVLLRPSGSIVGVYAASTGELASASVVAKTRRLLRKHAPAFVAVNRRRTSRPPATRRRTSRASR